MPTFVSESCRTSAPPRSAVRIRVVGRVRRELKRIIRAHTSEQCMVLRARTVLLAASGLNNSEVAWQLDTDVKTVRKWRGRFQAEGIAGLEDRPRPGRPPRFDSKQKSELFTLVVSPPPEPYGRWTMDLLVDHLIGSGFVTCISRETVSLWLRSADLKPHRVKYWLNSKDPDFNLKRDRVLELYKKKPPDGRVLCIDEKTSIQALEKIAPDAAVAARRARRVEFEYRRHGTVNLIASFEVHTGRVAAQCVDRNDSSAFIAFLKGLLRHYPKGKLYLVLDNGTTHRSNQTREFLARHPRLVPVFLPTHASWLNQVEIWFSALSRQALKNVSFVSQEALRLRILAYVEAHNRELAAPYAWTYDGQPCSSGEKAARLKALRRRKAMLRSRNTSRVFRTGDRRPGSCPRNGPALQHSN